MNNLQPNNGKAMGSMILGIVSIVAWIIPLIGLPVHIIGLVLGAMSVKTPAKSKAIIGIVLCGLGLIACIFNMYLGYLLVTQQIII